VSDPGVTALRDLHAYRRRKRIEQLDWFDSAYRAYLTGIVGIVLTLVVASWIGDGAVSPAGVADTLERGPAVVGLVVATAVALGLRSGSRGGPLALEAAEVRYVLLAPVDRRRALLGNALRSIRFASFAGVVTGAVVGYLAHRRFDDGATAAWVAAGAASGLLVALALVGSALVASGLRLARWLATVLALVVLAWAAASLVTGVPALTTFAGGVAVWPLEVDPVDLVGVLAVVALVAVGLVTLGGLRLEDAERRTALVGQLRFAVTVQDLRTVIVLRRQLAQDRPRQRPWIRVRPGSGAVVWRRGWHGLLRFPLARLGRMFLLGIIAGVALHGAYHGTTPLVALAGVALYLAALDAIEPMAQEVDQADRSDALPVERGPLLARHAAVPAVMMAVVGLPGLAVAIALNRTGEAAGVAGVAFLPAVLAAAAGAAISVVMGAPEPVKDGQLLPPEVAGMRIALRTVMPLVVSVVGTLPVVFARRAADAGFSPVLGAVQAAFLPLLLVALTFAWVRFREPAKVWFAKMMEESQQAAKAREAQRGRAVQ
jgi:hypothetical protein